MSTTTKKTKNPLYAAIGAGTTALEKARALPQRVTTLPGTLKKVDVRGLPKQISSFGSSVPQRVGELVDRSKKLTETAPKARIQKLQKRASKTYTDYSKRGEKLVTRISKSAPKKRAVEQTKSARARIKAAATSVRKAAESNIEAVTSAVDKATSEQAS